MFLWSYRNTSGSLGEREMNTDYQNVNSLSLARAVIIRQQVVPGLCFYRFYIITHVIRNRNHVPCFYGVTETRVGVWENEK